MKKSEIKRLERYLNEKSVSYEYKLLDTDSIEHVEIIVINKVTNSFEVVLSFAYGWDNKQKVYRLEESPYMLKGARYLPTLNYLVNEIRKLWFKAQEKPNI